MGKGVCIMSVDGLTNIHSDGSEQLYRTAAQLPMSRASKEPITTMMLL